MEVNSILTTGGNGFLGSVLTTNLRQRGFAVEDIRDRTTLRIDISNPFTLPENIQVDIVLHMAGKAHSVPKNDIEEKAFFDVNLEGTKNLCTAIDELNSKPKAFVFVSTVSVYGLNKGESINENYPLIGNTPYARSKVLAEEFLKDWAEKRNIILGIIRLPLIAGPNPPGNLGAMIKGIKTGKYLSIGRADAKKSVVYANDIASVIPRLAEVGGAYNLTDGFHPSFGDLEGAISSALGRSNPFKIPMFLANIMGKAGDLLGSNAPINSDKLKKITSTLTFDDSKARRELGWNPTRVIDRIPEIV